MASSRGSSSTPDWQDVSATMEALEQFHASRITVTFGLPAPGKPGLLFATAKAERTFASAAAAVNSVSRSCQIGFGDATMVAAAIFRLLYDLDRDCGQMWAQEELFRKA